MPSAIVISSGTRGDVEPLLSLSVTLLSHNFTTIHVFLQPEHMQLAPKTSHILPHELPYGMRDFTRIREQVSQASQVQSLTTKRGQMPVLSAILKDAILTALPDVLQVVGGKTTEQHGQERPTVVIATGMAALVAQTIAHKFGIPLCIIHLQPNVPTTAYPYHLLDHASARLAVSRITSISENAPKLSPDNSFPKGYTRCYESCLETPLVKLNEIRAEWGLSTLSLRDVVDCLCVGTTRNAIIAAYPTQLVQRSPEWGPYVYTTGALSDDYIPPGWKPERECPRLFEYIQRETGSEKAFLVTFGSIDFCHSTIPVTRALLTALRTRNVKRVIILKGRADIHHDILKEDTDISLRQWASEAVFYTDEAPQYAWLLPHMCGMLCHGGGGTVAAGLRAGISIAVVPWGSDQYFWGCLLQQLNVGALVTEHVQSVSVPDFERALDIVLDSDVRTKAMRMRKEILNGVSGRNVTATIISKIASDIVGTSQ